MIKFIADVGSNFEGSKEKAKQYIKICREIGIDIVKFQCWEVEDLFSSYHPAYNTLKEWGFPLGLPLEWHDELKKEADDAGIIFSTTPTQPYQIEKLEEIGLEVYKVASGDLTFYPLLDEINKTKKKVILSTGMATISEIEMSLNRLKSCREVVLLHCVSLYPPDFSEMNLKAIRTLKENFPECAVGISDHSLGNEVALASIALGISYIEKHIALSRELKTLDASFSLLPEEFKKLVTNVKQLEKAMGNGKKIPSLREKGERFWARRGIYAKRDIERGEIINLSNVLFLRPCKGISAEDIDFLSGKKAKRKIKNGDSIFWDHVE
ncbi:MAG: N-acetylneuraminate synthase family protein [Desulfonauticus sp.]|nr:N-acetylneuraminate synthase family protein [Desulfonauticus sp.]